MGETAKGMFEMFLQPPSSRDRMRFAIKVVGE
jgi:hypothetical protein